MSDADEEFDETTHLAEVAAHLRDHRAELHVTVRAIQSGRYTRRQIEAVIDCSRRLVYRSRVKRQARLWVRQSNDCQAR